MTVMPVISADLPAILAQSRHASHHRAGSPDFDLRLVAPEVFKVDHGGGWTACHFIEIAAPWLPAIGD